MNRSLANGIFLLHESVAYGEAVGIPDKMQNRSEYGQFTGDSVEELILSTINNRGTSHVPQSCRRMSVHAAIFILQLRFAGTATSMRRGLSSDRAFIW